MMNQIVLRQIADFQMLNGSFNSNLGLFNGKMGIALFFFFYAQSVHCDLYEEFAGELLDDICNNLSTHLPVTFGDGLCGIGWGVEFMKRQGFIEGETDEILYEIDMRIMERDLRRISDISFETGLEGIVTYIQSRINSSRVIRNRQPYDCTYLMELETACQKADISYNLNQYDMDEVWNRVLRLFSSSFTHDEKDSWKKGLTIIGANYE